MIKHRYETILPNDPTKEISKDVWEQGHDFSDGADGSLLVRDTGLVEGGYSWIAPPAAGEVLGYVAGAWGPVTPTPSVVFVAALNVTAAQFRSLNSAPLTVVAAQGAGFAVVPVHWSFEQAIGATSFSGSPNINLRYNGVDEDLMTSFTLANASNRNGSGGGPPKSFSGMGIFQNGNNAALKIRSSVDVTSGSGSFRVTVLYYIMSSLF